MNKINTSNWKEFSVKSLGFNIYHGKRIKKAERVEGLTIFLTAGKENCGVVGTIGNDVNLWNCPITVDMFGNAFYHNYECSGDDNIYAFVNDNLNSFVKMFIASAINAKTRMIYSYTDQFRQRDADTLTVKLPTTVNGLPDFEYMENYMKTLENIVNSSLTNLQAVKNFSAGNQIDTYRWKTFQISDVFPIIKKPYVYHTKHVVEDENGIPYVVRSKFNNGIKYYVKKPNGSVNPANVISFGAENATFFYQKEEWISGRDIYYIDTRHLTEYACLFITACLQPIASKYSYNFGLFPELLKKEKIKLPITSTGNPDYAYMENYMLTILNKAQNSLNRFITLN